MEIEQYYRSPSGDFRLLRGDSLEVLPELTERFDMVFADPPYFLSGGGISCQSSRIVSVDKGTWDTPSTPEAMDAFNAHWLAGCRELMADHATIWVSGTLHNIFSVQQQMLRLGFKILNVITWVKTNPPPNLSRRYFTFSTEFILWARKSPKTPHYYNYALMKELNGGSPMTDVWRLPAIGRWEKRCGKHPTQKPLSVLARIVQASTEPGALVLDPFSGSATTGIAANLLCRNFVGIEREEEFLELGRNRREALSDPAVLEEHLRRLGKTQGERNKEQGTF